MSKDIAISIHGLSKNFKDSLAVDSISLQIKQHEIFSLLGVNGAGKSTTIKLLTGLLKPTRGTATILDYDLIEDIDKIKPFINISPQETAIAMNLTVKENLQLMAGIYKIDKQFEKIEELLQLFHLKEVEKKLAGKLSGGYQRRLSIAMSLINDPKILFLDEPTLGLDVLSKHELWKIIQNIKNKTTIILTTHYMDEADVLSDRVAIMVKGKILQCQEKELLKKQYQVEKLEDAFIKIVESEDIL